MLFNSPAFALFLPIVFALYWAIPSRRWSWQNALLLVASYYFYACWDVRFLALLFFSTWLDYYTGLRMDTELDPRKRKTWFVLSVVVNLGFLGVFKYYDYFAVSFAQALADIGVMVHPRTLAIILPVGISFYTFHGLSYVIDIHQRRIKAERSFLDYALFVSFFPLLVAGPIERATHLLPQLKRPRIFDRAKAVDGLRQILWGLFKKMVIADGCAPFVDEIFASPGERSGSELLIGAVLFSFQIYGDFSGYTDIASGTARLFGIELLRNFAYPYFSRDIAEFWRRWHISLSSWFRDYVYIPLGGSAGGTAMRVRNILIIFLLSGLWHGANWTFVAWGALNALLFLPLLLMGRNRAHTDGVAEGRILPTVRELFSMVITFALVTLAWVFFRSDDMAQAWLYLKRLFTVTWLVRPALDMSALLVLLVIIGLFMAVEWLGRSQPFAIARLGLRWPTAARFAFYYAIGIVIFLYAGGRQEFIYFQF